MTWLFLLLDLIDLKYDAVEDECRIHFLLCVFRCDSFVLLSFVILLPSMLYEDEPLSGTSAN